MSLRTRMLARPTLVALAAACLACEPDGEGPPPDAGFPEQAGLKPRGERFVPLTHAAEAIVDGELVYQSVSGSGLQVYSLAEGASGVLLRSVMPDVFDENGFRLTPRCTTLARHATSGRVICAAADDDRISVLDVSDPDAVRWAVAGEPRMQGSAGFRDLAADGDTLYVAAQSAGLLRGSIAADGAPGTLEQVVADVSVSQVEVAGGDVVVLDRSGRLLVYAPGGEALALRASVELDGPPVDLAVRGKRAAVSLASRGVVLLDLDDATPRETARVVPEAVATCADFLDDRLAVGTLTGTYLYDLRGAAPRLAGYYPAGQGVLDVHFQADGELVVTDWDHVRRFATDVDGTWFLPDVPPGFYVEAGEDVALPVFVPGDAPMRVKVLTQRAIERDGFHDVEVTLLSEPALQPGVNRVTIPGDAVAAAAQPIHLGSGWGPSGATVVVVPEGFPVGAWDLSTGWVGRATLVVRPAASKEPPLPGETLPAFEPKSAGGTAFRIPVAGQATRILSYVIDCALQWPHLEDAAWHAQHVAGAPRVVVVTRNGRVSADYVPIQFREFATASASVVALGDYDGFTFENAEDEWMRRFGGAALRGPDATGDYLLDANGVVLGFERMYRGRFALLQ